MVTRETGPDRRYGLGRSLGPIVEAMLQRGIAARYFCQDALSNAQLQQRERFWSRVLRWPGIAGHPARIAMLRAWTERLQVGALAARVARDEHYTHVHAHDPWIALGVAYGLVGSPTCIRWGVTEHGFGSYAEATRLDGLDQNRFTQRLLRRIERFVLGRADWVTAPTVACLDALARDLALGTRPAHWHAVPHARPGVAVRTAASRSAARAQLGWAADDIVVLAVGRLVPLKGFDRIIEAVASLQMPVLRLAIVGGGDPAPLQALAQARGIGDRVRFEFVDDMTPWLHGADIYVSASSTESFGLANLEALCAGLPCICTPVGGVPEVVGDAAVLVAGDIASLAQAIGALARDAAMRHDRGVGAAARGAAWPDAPDITQRYVDIYQAARQA